MAAVTWNSAFFGTLRAQENKVHHCFHSFPIYLPWSGGTGSLYFECWVLSQLFHSPLSPSRGSLVPLHFPLSGWCPLHIWGYWYFSQQSWASDSSSLVFLMMYSAYKLNKQGDNIQPWVTPFLIWNQSVVPCPVLTVASWHAYRFHRRQVTWSGIPISLRIFHS